MNVLKDEKPLVSVIIPCYNHEQFVQECIQSVIDQDYDNIELIIIDDGSKDHSVQKIEEMSSICNERFVRFEFRHRPNEGLCATLNEGLDWCKGKFYSPSASDDILYPDKISTQVNAFLKDKTDEIVAVFTGITMLDKHKKVIQKKSKEQKFGFSEVFLRTAWMPGQAVMLNLEKVKNIGGYDKSIAIEDLDLFLRLAKQGLEFRSIKKPLVYYRRHDDNLSSKSDLMLQAVMQILEKYKSETQYVHAVSNSLMIEAHSCQLSNKIKSQEYLKYALEIYPKNIFSKSFMRYLIKKIIHYVKK